VRRHAGRGSYDRETVDAILDAGTVAHVGVVAEGQPVVIPMIYARAGEHIYLHGSPLSRLLGSLAEAIPMCLTVTLLDGLVLARSAFHHSVNYRSVVVMGDGYGITHPEHKSEALRRIVEHVVPGRSAEVRGPSDKELAATEIVAVAIREASAKVRTGPPVDTGKDYEIPVWAGQVPLNLTRGEPVPDSRCSELLPNYLQPQVVTHA
jgi:nitroimidazol reductase NimA-like FMN-containing flavoprotein (pyridoxamine 5'-phosphate oxidase superfamily)